ncbi:MAG: hypothetical protein CMM94_00015 [Rickettsiales bacterium]|nr:hypothetical protein [Rickettsiales bacterium]
MTGVVTQSWDTAIKTQKGNDASACATFVQEGDAHRLVDMWVGRLEYPALRRKVLALAEEWQPHAVLIEDKASGQSLIQDVRREASVPVVAICPKGDKVTRLAQVCPMIEAGKVALPRYASWLSAFEQELCAFPNGRHDDQVDAFSQYLNWVRARQWQQARLRRV